MICMYYNKQLIVIILSPKSLKEVVDPLHTMIHMWTLKLLNMVSNHSTVPISAIYASNIYYLIHVHL